MHTQYYIQKFCRENRKMWKVQTRTSMKIRTQTQNKYKRLNKKFEKEYLTAEVNYRKSVAQHWARQRAQRRGSQSERWWLIQRHNTAAKWSTYTLSVSHICCWQMGSPVTKPNKPRANLTSELPFGWTHSLPCPFAQSRKRQCRQRGAQGRAELLLQTKQLNSRLKHPHNHSPRM